MFDLLMTTHFQIPVHISTVAIGKIFVLGEVMHKEFQKDSVHVNIFKNSVPIKRIQGCFIPLHLFKSFQADIFGSNLISSVSALDFQTVQA